MFVDQDGAIKNLLRRAQVVETKLAMSSNDRDNRGTIDNFVHWAKSLTARANRTIIKHGLEGHLEDVVASSPIRPIPCLNGGAENIGFWPRCSDWFQRTFAGSRNKEVQAAALAEKDTVCSSVTNVLDLPHQAHIGFLDKSAAQLAHIITVSTRIGDARSLVREARPQLAMRWQPSITATDKLSTKDMLFVVGRRMDDTVRSLTVLHDAIARNIKEMETSDG